jgi:soluble lytic murein transglycosylase
LSHQRDGRTAEAEQTFKRLVSRAPSTAWNAKALSALGLLYETRQDTERACAAYAELMTRFPTEDRADEMAWRIGWLRYGQRSYGTAAREFAAAAARFPQSLFVSNALYWQAKTLEKNGNSVPAMALYARVAREYPYTYYGIRAEEILLARTSSSGPVRNGLLATHPLSPGEPSPRFTAAPTLSPQALFHRVRVDELLALRFLEDAREEVGQLAKRLGAGFTEQLFLAGLYLNIGQTTQAIRILNATLSTVDPDARLTLPNDFWTLLFPQLYWEEVQESAQQSQLDPLLLLGVIRQESAFNARAVSRSDARGLMQLLPSTGRELAQQLRMGPFQTEVLFDPRVNVRLGAHYLQRLTGVHQGNVILALAAYNAGPTRVKRWLQEMGIADWDEFVEGLPFEETRSYVKSVLRNYGVYRKLYAVGTITTDERR